MPTSRKKVAKKAAKKPANAPPPATDGSTAIQLRVVKLPVDSLILHPRNARQGDVDAIADSLKANGQFRAIVVQASTNHVLAGNHTLLGARKLGWKKIAAHVIDVDDDKALQILLADNRASDFSVYDESALLALLKDVEAGPGLEPTLFDGEDLQDLAFKLGEGGKGSGYEKPDLGSRTKDYKAKDMRTIMLPYTGAQYDVMVKKLSALRGVHGCENNSELVQILVDKATQ